METTTEEHIITTINPATGEELASHQYITDEQLTDSIENCNKAFLQWRNTSLEERANAILSIGKSLKIHKSELAKMMTSEMGKLLSQSEQEIDLCIAICEYTAENGPSALQNQERKLLNGGRGIVTYSPLGVIYGIQPWNYPSYQVIRYAVASIMAGNGVLLKHASNVTGSAKILEKVFNDSDLPKSLFTLLIIDHEQSDYVIKNNLVKGVTLTGSSIAGKEIGKKAGVQLKKTVLELGSNDAYLVLEDANIELAVKMCVKGRIYNNGETCIAAKRFIVVDSVYESFKDNFVAAMKAIRIGDPFSDQSDMGPIAREDLRDKLHDQVVESVSKGAEILCGGKIPEGAGFYYPATVLELVEPGQPAYDDELFGPVASLIKAKDDEDAFRIANDSRFGLGGGIFSEDIEKAIKLAENNFDTGMIFINSFGLAEPNMPFGGVKDSGFGREHGGFGVKEFVNVKSIMIRD
ncbi:NAD-dependent succinate-semialdehyde dehydrogenase [Aquimarina spongiae]|uniref:Succinate-semialdehyde dehydrogenase / glutarate-semialdehyde dehydrogenase n=1 Tax=Aquimarina spongiae TaxID=570521 RepID=A0A1M6GKY5_9FLAO|nr:NAD-dependent succinate-semialdehyde dehydrogenase [Aquimarina spongiae]SHJ10580.1 succinate-semialdehyde dehydrogenase / glutarate-semialdehyde dehydrogenase [Aquimarina spongiae]